MGWMKFVIDRNLGENSIVEFSWSPLIRELNLRPCHLRVKVIHLLKRNMTPSPEVISTKRTKLQNVFYQIYLQEQAIGAAQALMGFVSCFFLFFFFSLEISCFS